jgi:hypothetical protein
MAISLQEIQNRIAALVDRNASAPNNTSNHWNQRLSYINSAQDEWAQLYDWQALYKEYNTLTSTASGNTSIALPSDFRKLASYPRVNTGTADDGIAEIRPQEKDQFLPNSDRFMYILGNYNDGYTMVVNPGNSTGNLASGASIYVPYYSSAPSLVSPTDISPIPDPDFLVKKAESYWYRSFGDNRWTTAEQEAQLILQRMLNRENTHSEATNTYNRIRTVEETRFNHRWGK